MANIERSLLFRTIMSVALLGFLTSSSMAEEQIFTVSKLRMFVDELPDMPKVHGFEFVNGVPKSKSLKIGMFKKKWVRANFH